MKYALITATAFIVALIPLSAQAAIDNDGFGAYFNAQIPAGLEDDHTTMAISAADEAAEEVSRIEPAAGNGPIVAHIVGPHLGGECRFCEPVRRERFHGDGIRQHGWYGGFVAVGFG